MQHGRGMKGSAPFQIPSTALPSAPALCRRRKWRPREVQQPAQGYGPAGLTQSWASLGCPCCLPEHSLGSRIIASAPIPESPGKHWAPAFPVGCGGNKTIAAEWTGFPGADGEGSWGDVVNGGPDRGRGAGVPHNLGSL